MSVFECGHNKKEGVKLAVTRNCFHKFLVLKLARD